ncbi:hypothetical protein ACP4OV_014810 [Aristida adscensionis]
MESTMIFDWSPFTYLANITGIVCHTLFMDFTNINRRGESNASNMGTEVINPKEYKRQKDRDRTEEQRNERIKKQRESRQKKKAQQMINTVTTDGNNSSSTYAQIINPSKRKRQRERKRYAKMSNEKQKERNRKQRETRQGKKTNGTHNTDDGCALDMENRRTSTSVDWLHIDETYQRVQTRLRVRKYRENKRNTLHRDSIAMQNPLYVPEVVGEL